jgi:hypothetical protein
LGTVDVELHAGACQDGFGWKGFSVGGHASGFEAWPAPEFWLHPQGFGAMGDLEFDPRTLPSRKIAHGHLAPDRSFCSLCDGF